jgi:hypothetical protein
LIGHFASGSNDNALLGMGENSADDRLLQPSSAKL